MQQPLYSANFSMTERGSVQSYDASPELMGGNIQSYSGILNSDQIEYSTSTDVSSNYYDTIYQSDMFSMTRTAPTTAVMRRKPRNVLCLDGGGMRGLVQCEMLNFIEQYTGTQIHELFDLIVGTSTGAILASMIAIKKNNTASAVEQYRIFGRRLFGKKRWRDWVPVLIKEDKGLYGSRGFPNYSRMVFGSNPLLDPNNTDPTPKIALVACELDKDSEKYKCVLFRNYISRYRDRGSEFNQIKICEAVQASTAAPIYLDAMKIEGSKFYDGAILNNNPTLQAIMEARVVFGKDEQFNIVSLGTGESSLTHPSTSNGPIPPPLNLPPINEEAQDQEGLFARKKKKKKNSSYNLIRLLSICADNNRIIRDVEKYIATSCRPDQIHYQRFSPEDLGDIPLVVEDPVIWNHLQVKTREYIQAHLPEFQLMCEKLIESNQLPMY